MTVVARTFASVPARSAIETWKAIVELIAPDPQSPARSELDRVQGVSCSIIASEMRVPIVVHGGGCPRVRIYCVYGDDAIEGEGVRETALSFIPTEGDWRMSLPCPTEELEWVCASLRSSARVSARDEDEPVAEEAREGDRTERGSNGRRGTAVVDLDAFLRR